MDTTEPILEGMFNNIEEQELLFSALTSESIVLEWGSGKSTAAMAKRCKWLYSIEHNAAYFSYTNLLLESEGIANVNLFHIPNNQDEVPGHDGTFDEYEDYVLSAARIYCRIGSKKFNVIVIDGRCRVTCALMAAILVKKDGFIFIHDYKHPTPEYRRHEYEEVEQFLKLEAQAYAMAKFTVK